MRQNAISNLTQSPGLQLRHMNETLKCFRKKEITALTTPATRCLRSDCEIDTVVKAACSLCEIIDTIVTIRISPYIHSVEKLQRAHQRSSSGEGVAMLLSSRRTFSMTFAILFGLSNARSQSAHKYPSTVFVKNEGESFVSNRRAVVASQANSGGSYKRVKLQ